MKTKRKNSGIIIIGNEILSGKTLEKNSNFICKNLRNIGILCKEIVVIPDDKKQIIQKVNEFRKKYDYVFTTGGIGPTHDDITAESISEAFKDDLVVNQEAKQRLQSHYSDEDFTKPRLKMAFLPSKAKLIDNPVSIAPGFSVENVYVFPGVPKIMEVMFVEFLKTMKVEEKIYKKNITTHLSEGLIGEYLESVQNKFKDLEIGSYPYFKNNSFGVSLLISGDKKNRVDSASKLIFDYLSIKKGKPRLF